MKLLAVVALVLLVACTPRPRIAAHVVATTTVTASVSMPPVPPTVGRASRSRPRVPHEAPSGTAAGDLWDRVATCESGRDPRARSGPYFGAFQFTLSSWHSAGMAGDPRDYDYATQKATAIRWAAMTNPYRQWPVCYPRALGGGGGRSW